jgi:dienelactone hydrolase
MASEYIALERPDWTRARIAPSGDKFAAVRWHDGAANLWIGTGQSPMQLASDLRPWLLRDYFWSSDGTCLILEVELPGTELRVLAWLDLRARTLTRLTPGLGADARYAGQLGGRKPGVMIGVRYPQTSSYELQAVSPTGAVLAEWKGPGRPVSHWLATAAQAVAVCADEDGQTWWQTELQEPSWSQILTVPAADAASTRPLAFSADGKSLFCLSTAGRDTIALLKLSAPSWTPELLSGRDGFDVVSVLMAPDGSGPDLVTTTDPAATQEALSPEAAADLSHLHRTSDAPAVIIGRNDTHCLAEVPGAVGGPGLVMVGRGSGAVSKPLPRFTGFARVSMRQRDAFRFTARDGLAITGFLTRPTGAPPWPTVLVVHDGPWARDGAQIDPWAQSLAAAGLCCVQVNYRGSRGFGKQFARSGDRQWSRAMQDDLVDALRAEPVAAVADPKRITAIGYGYGGYAALMLAAQREVPLAGAAAAAAPTDLIRYVSGLMSFGGSAGFARAARIGHPVDDRELLVAASPVNRATDIGAPVLLFHGRQDARVPVSHATTLAESMRRAGHSCELIIYEDEGHRFFRPQNLADMRARTVSFLLRQ